MAEESKIEQKLKRAVEKRGGLCLKFISPSYTGVPDRLILIAFGKVAFVEIKAPGKKPRPLQLARINKIRSLGFLVYVLDNEQDIEKILDEIEGGHNGI